MADKLNVWKIVLFGCLCYTLGSVLACVYNSPPQIPTEEELKAATAVAECITDTTSILNNQMYLQLDPTSHSTLNQELSQDQTRPFDPLSDSPLPLIDNIDQDSMVCVMYVFFGKLTSFYTYSEDYPAGSLLYFGPDAFIAVRDYAEFHNLPKPEFVRENIINFQQFMKLLKTAPNCPEELKSLIDEFIRHEEKVPDSVNRKSPR